MATFADKIERQVTKDLTEWLSWRQQRVGASEAACLFGDDLHPFLSAFELWARKTGRAPHSRAETPAMRRGKALEAIVIDMVREQQPEWVIEPNIVSAQRQGGLAHYFDPVARIGATPDAFIVEPVHAILQIKTADYNGWRKHWINKDGEVEVPLWICIQATIEAAMVGCELAFVAVLNMGLWEVHIVEVPLVPSVMERLYELVADFWERVRTGDFYPPRWNSDVDLIGRIFAEAKGREVDLRTDNRIGELLTYREALKAREADGSKAHDERKKLDAEIVLKLEDADRAILPDGRILWAPTRRRKAYEVAATSWRQITVKEGDRR